jgi:hypothetical protein
MTIYEHSITTAPDLNALAAAASAAISQPVQVVWRDEQEVDGETLIGLVGFVDEAGERVEVDPGIVQELLANTTPVVSWKDQVLTDVAAAATVEDLQGILATLLDRL